MKKANELTTEDIEILNNIVENGGNCHTPKDLSCANCPVFVKGSLCYRKGIKERALYLLREYNKYIDSILLEQE